MRWMFGFALSAFASLAAPCAAAPCETHPFEGSAFTVCTFDARHDTLRLAWRDAAGAALRSLTRLRAFLGPDAVRVRFAMNAGMFQEDGKPLGLYVERGRELRPLNGRSADGNFYLKPNGVFLQARNGTVAIEETGIYDVRKGVPLYATQSGPLLVLGGAFNPQISADGPSRNIRNGVGVRDAHTALFVVSDGPVSFGRLARLFRDELKCPDALYFDGSISSAWIPSQNRMDDLKPLGPMVVVLAKSTTAPGGASK